MDIKNSEGYTDPTPYVAIKKIAREERKFRPLVYICSPYSGNVELNTERARKFCRYALDEGCIPIAPHLLFPQFVSEDEERDLAMFMDMVLLGKCRELWVFGDEITEGMKMEIGTAVRRQQPVRYFSESCEEVPEP